jgi:hypothetical protein
MEKRDSSISVERLADEIRALYQSNFPKAETSIETYIQQNLKGFSTVEKKDLLEKLIHQFENNRIKVHPDLDFESKEFLRLFSLLLGKRISSVDLSRTEVLERLAHSLNTIFNTLNQIIGVIQTTLLGKKTEFDETIRHIIGSDLEGSAGTISLQGYLDQIQEAFLVSHQAFKEAAQTKVGEILKELNPDHIEATTGGGLKFGPLRKAELYEIYKEKFQTCKTWTESGRFIEELLREFEKKCQKRYKAEKRGTP